MPLGMTREARCARAEQVVREQRDPDGEYGALGNPDYASPPPRNVYEALLEQELVRLQRAVMGEED